MKETSGIYFYLLSNFFLQIYLKIRRILKCVLPALHFRNKNPLQEDQSPAIPVKI